MQLQKESLIIFRLSRMQTLTSVILRINYSIFWRLSLGNCINCIFNSDLFCIYLFLLQFKYMKLIYSSLKKL